MLMKRETRPTLTRQRLNSPLSLSNWLDDIFEDAFNWTEGTFVPDMNVYETAKQFEVTVELPGMDKNDFDISLNDNVLTISGERRIKDQGKENGRKYHRVESRFGKFSRSLPLPNVADTDKIEAAYENGVLAITIPKLKEKTGRKIKIK
ncbi:Hsp20/alpha crystallin family protein [Rhodohalobacter sp. WB101]|uniref:Hsp20/alpha crystallin family protein n=2 Tax=Rhodohalobacter sulfatireducens TaxID=2911366 RepID=A0ABS9K7W3_9BACT|nr:Hsp20/alpha crystallin family protein [Rhodohalobacter sulfatireducens]